MKASLASSKSVASPLTRQDSVADVMTINRLEEILPVLHANGNELMKKQGEPGYDRLHKVRPLLTIINAQFKRNAEPEKCVSVDVQIIPFEGRTWAKKNGVTKIGFLLVSQGMFIGSILQEITRCPPPSPAPQRCSTGSGQVRRHGRDTCRESTKTYLCLHWQLFRVASTPSWAEEARNIRHLHNAKEEDKQRKGNEKEGQRVHWSHG